MHVFRFTGSRGHDDIFPSVKDHGYSNWKAPNYHSRYALNKIPVSGNGVHSL